MTNEEKAKTLVDGLDIIYTDCNRVTIKKLLMKMADWKDEQQAKEKQQWIDKAMKVICNGCAQKAECEFNNWKTCSTKDELIKATEE